MPDYSKAKIYQIISPNYPLPYIGSTTQPLYKRMTCHRTSSDGCRSRIVIDAGDAYIELIEEFPCQNKEQLNKREGEVIRERECVNRKIEGRTSKEYYTDNRDKHNAWNKANYQANREAINARHIAYNKANRDTINAKRRETRAKKKAQQSVECITTPSVADELISSIPTDPSTSLVEDSFPA